MTDQIKPIGGVVDNGVFYFPIRIYYEDTDAEGIVYYANYLKFAERARTEFLRFSGINQQRHLQESGCGFVVRSCNIDYVASAVLDDKLTVSCQISELGAAFAVIRQKIYRSGELLCTLEVKVVYMNINTRRPTRIPTAFVEQFRKFCE